MRGECNFGVQSECVLGLAFLCWVPVCVGPINGPHPVLSVGLCVGRPVNARGTGQLSWLRRCEPTSLWH